MNTAVDQGQAAEPREPGQFPDRVLFVHAHPDDESIVTGGTIALLTRSGTAVTVLTCTRGERGEVVPSELAGLSGVALAAHREGELATAMAALGVTDHRFLGSEGARAAGLAPRRYLDSGMQWGPSGPEAVADADPASFCAAAPGEVAADIATVIAAAGATAVVSYDERGGYGHPDHVRAHVTARHAARVMGVPFFSIVTGPAEPGDRSLDISPVREAKIAALRAHRSQLTVEGESIVHSGGQQEPIGLVESFRPEATQELGAAHGVEWSELSLPWRAGIGLLAVVTGAIVGGIGTVNHQSGVTMAGLALPIGVIAALALCAVLFAGARLYFGTRTVAACAALGALSVIALLSAEGPGGSVLIPGNESGWAWIVGATVIAGIVLAWPRPGTFRRVAAASSPSTAVSPPPPLPRE